MLWREQASTVYVLDFLKASELVLSKVQVSWGSDLDFLKALCLVGTKALVKACLSAVLWDSLCSGVVLVVSSALLTVVASVYEMDLV